MRPTPPNIVSGPMPGYISLRSAVIWLQTDRPTEAVVEYWPGSRSSDRAWSRPFAVTAEESCTAKIVIDDLDMNTVYTYRVWLDGQPVDFDDPLRFRTDRLWQWRSSPPTFEMACGSCAFIVDPDYDRPGTPFGGGYEIFDSIAEQQPHLMLWLGDNIYLREADYGSEGGIDFRYRQVRSFPPLQRLLRSTHHAAIWDDHDFGPNNSNQGYSFKDATLAAFKRYWANPRFGLPEVAGIFSSWFYADVEFFMLDDRYHRDSDEGLGDDRVLYGEEQMRWLRNALLASESNFKLICGGSQFLDDDSGAEGWHRFPQERDAFLDWFREARPRGVMFLSGDRHTTKLCRFTDDVPYPLYEFVCSPLCSQPRSPNVDNLPAGVLRETIVDQRNFGILRFSGRFSSRVLQIRCHDTNGEQLWAQTIRHRDLR